MEDIIKQIVQIDSVALTTKKGNEEALRLKKEQYEKEIVAYKEEVLGKAQKEAKSLYDHIVSKGEEDAKLEEERSQKKVLLMKNYYLQVEDKLLNQLFSELFGVEE